MFFLQFHQHDWKLTISCTRTQRRTTTASTRASTFTVTSMPPSRRRRKKVDSPNLRKMSIFLCRAIVESPILRKASIFHRRTTDFRTSRLKLEWTMKKKKRNEKNLEIVLFYNFIFNLKNCCSLLFFICHLC